MRKKAELKPEALPELSAIVTALGSTRDRLETIALRYDRETIADRLWLGVCCMAAQERHALPANARGQGRKKHSIELSEISPDEAHPQGFLAWLGNACPWLKEGTAYKYINAAKGAGMTAWTTEADLRKWVAELLARDESLSLKSLIDAGKKLLPPSKENEGGSPDYIQLTFDSILAFGAQADSVLTHAERMTPKQRDLASAQAYRTLRELTGQAWAPSDTEHEHFARVLEEARKGGL